MRLDGPLDFLGQLFDSFRQSWGERVNRLANQIYALGQNLNEITAGYFAEDLGPDSFAVNPFRSQPDLLIPIESFARTNAQLIKGIGDQAVNKVERLVLDAFVSGEANKTLAKKIQAVSTEFGKHRAKLIARDQVSKLGGQLTMTRAKSAGSDKYIWQTVGDERVRKSHKELNNKTRRWSESPIPGQEIQCRCFAVPVWE
jgi:SPP1 gp7 family putative phage head morphogenesis protein